MSGSAAKQKRNRENKAAQSKRDKIKALLDEHNPMDKVTFEANGNRHTLTAREWYKIFKLEPKEEKGAKIISLKKHGS